MRSGVSVIASCSVSGGLHRVEPEAAAPASRAKTEDAVGTWATGGMAGTAEPVWKPEADDSPVGNISSKPPGFAVGAKTKIVSVKEIRAKIGSNGGT